MGNHGIDEQTGTPIPCRPLGHDVWLRGLDGVQGQGRVQTPATPSFVKSRKSLTSAVVAEPCLVLLPERLGECGTPPTMG